LRIKAFCGMSENAVKSQVWLAIAACVFVVIVKKRPNIHRNFYTTLQILSITLLDKIHILRPLSIKKADEIEHEDQQLLIRLD
jgi:hypothetical protein